MANDFKLNLFNIGKLKTAQKTAALKTAESIKTDMVARKVIPFDDSTLQVSTHTYETENGAKIGYGAGLDKDGFNYAAKQYMDSNLKHDKGPHAGTATDHWDLDYQENGTKNKWVNDKYGKHFKKEFNKLNGGITNDK